MIIVYDYINLYYLVHICCLVDKHRLHLRHFYSRRHSISNHRDSHCFGRTQKVWKLPKQWQDVNAGFSKASFLWICIFTPDTWRQPGVSSCRRWGAFSPCKEPHRSADRLPFDEVTFSVKHQTWLSSDLLSRSYYLRWVWFEFSCDMLGAAFRMPVALTSTETAWCSTKSFYVGGVISAVLSSPTSDLNLKIQITSGE